MKMHVLATVNQVLDEDTAVLVVEEMGHKIEVVAEDALERSVFDDYQELKGDRSPRAPVVTVMGPLIMARHHCSTVSANAGCSEAGGITQHIGAYHADTDNGMITFVDTSAAFINMRFRGRK